MTEVKCFNCGASETDRAYLKCHFKGKEDWVCVRCLPVLIHGAH